MIGVEKSIQEEFDAAVLSNSIKQLHSAPSFVFALETNEGERKYIAKIFVNAAVSSNFRAYDALLKKKEFQYCCTSLGTIVSSKTSPIQSIHVFPYFTPPLSRELARSCVLEFGKKLQDVLHKLHRIEIAHMDIRLPNICFSSDDQDQEVILILIDFERSHFVLDMTDYGNCCTYPKMTYCIYIDFIQLMWMILWIMLDDSTVFVYHEMDKLELSGEYLDLQHFICTKTGEWSEYAPNTDLSENQNIEDCVNIIDDAMKSFWNFVGKMCKNQGTCTLKDKLAEHKLNLPY